VKAGGRIGIRNPRRLSAVELNQYCGTCHRRPPEPGEINDGRIAVGLMFDWSNPWNTRQQPAYLNQSACFRGSAGALSCLTCHDPHDAAPSSAANYDRRCVSCHSAVRHETGTSRTGCVACHMPSVQTAPEMRFTNHWIGVYAKENPLVPVRRRNFPPLVLAATVIGKLQAPNDPASLRPLFEQAVVDRRKQLGPMHPKVARSAASLGLFLKDTGSPAAAEAPLRQALEIDRANHSPDVARAAEELAQILQVIGKQNDAMAMFREAAAGADARVSAESYASLAKLDRPRAVTYYREAVATEETASGKDSPRVATQLSNLALALRENGDLKAAEVMLRRALIIQEKALGRTHYQTATTLSNLGAVLQGMRRLSEAESLEREALLIFEKRRPQSMELAAICANLADLLSEKGDLAGAADLLRRAIATDEAAGGTEALETAADLASLGILERREKHPAAAYPLLQRALAIYELRLGPNSRQARDVRAELTQIRP
jgi:tetratricopeptide (TPR) repeat protein